MNSYPFVYVLILNFNQPLLTLQCVESFLASDYPNLKVLVVDNGSSSDNLEAIRKLRNTKLNLHRLINNLGYVGGMNYALQVAFLENPDYFLVSNNDVIIEKTAIKNMVIRSQRAGNKCIVTGKVYYFDKSNVIQYIGSELIDKKSLTYKHIGVNQIDNGQFDREEERDLIDDIYWLLPQKVYKHLGGYNKLFYFNGESADYCLRAQNAGFRLLYCPEAKLWHKGGGSIGGRDNNPVLAYYQTKSTLLFRYLHLKRKNFYMFYLKILRNALKNHLKGFIKIFIKDTSSYRCSNGELKGWFSFSINMLFGKYKQ
jgi:GT2 family glycosyltransferase